MSPTADFEPDDALSFADIVPLHLDWLWPSWVARGVLTLVDGDPEMGKSTLAFELAAHVSRGTLIRVPPAPAPVPPEEPDWLRPRRKKKQAPVVETPPPAPPVPETRPPRNVLILSAEEDAARTMRPRLDAAGADVRRVFVLSHPPGHAERPLQLPRDLAAIRAVIDRRQIALLVIDPVMAFLGSGVNSGSDQHVRVLLHQLKVLAEETQCAVFIIRHLNKKTHGPALYRGGGSIGFIAACRIALLVGKDPADAQRRVLVMNKCNLAVKPVPVRFHLEQRGPAAVLVWDGPCDWTAEEVLTKMSEELAEQLSRVDACADYLRQLLRDGKPMDVQLVEAFCREEGFSETTVNRARKKLRVQAIRHWRGWEVALPAEPPTPAEGQSPGA